jgi:hypothetical protein
VLQSAPDLRWYHPYLAVALIYLVFVCVVVYALLRIFIRPLIALSVLYYTHLLIYFVTVEVGGLVK